MALATGIEGTDVPQVRPAASAVGSLGRTFSPHQLPACVSSVTGWKPMPLRFRTMLSRSAFAFELLPKPATFRFAHRIPVDSVEIDFVIILLRRAGGLRLRLGMIRPVRSALRRCVVVAFASVHPTTKSKTLLGFGIRCCVLVDRLQVGFRRLRSWTQIAGAEGLNENRLRSVSIWGRSSSFTDSSHSRDSDVAIRTNLFRGRLTCHHHRNRLRLVAGNTVFRCRRNPNQRLLGVSVSTTPCSWGVTFSGISSSSDPANSRNLRSIRR